MCTLLQILYMQYVGLLDYMCHGMAQLRVKLACIGFSEIEIQRFRVQRFQFKGVERVLLHVWSSIHIKLIDSPLYHIKGKSVMKACWVELPCNGWESIQVIA